MLNDVTVAILAGGLSRRMGTNKSFVPLAGKPIITHVIERVSQLDLPIILITNSPEQYAHFGLPMFPDVYTERSSLVGLHSALYHSPSEYSLCVACDMPFLNPHLLRYMLSLPADYDCLVPQLGQNYESLHAIYRRSCIPIFEQQLQKGQRRIRDVYAQLRARYIQQTDIELYDPQHRSFMNLNSPDEVSQVADL
jgi:molybdopterin-guanine dinucleotide biosynthesis protein A